MILAVFPPIGRRTQALRAFAEVLSQHANAFALASHLLVAVSAPFLPFTFLVVLAIRAAEVVWNHKGGTNSLGFGFLLFLSAPPHEHLPQFVAGLIRVDRVRHLELSLQRGSGVSREA